MDGMERVWSIWNGDDDGWWEWEVGTRARTHMRSAVWTCKEVYCKPMISLIWSRNEW